ncbi:hypothetical protein PV10_05781 [Exophiala mesophila]|uniref:Zn(2)-C6 fungal-type domain-containing protein n=1 Tax=Exophiala mesophila TaxID=212818 RepID=A0A0D1ZB56_EXOME|nr:uncharacterized protein PV10_05781 [Exophiala mesophila]KIV91219.1 hypothetical protein PV10_05781 [Exophiala mesophila]
MSSMDPPPTTSLKRNAQTRISARPKRHKIAVACTECRERKRKCDGKRPVCGSCSRVLGKTSCTFVQDKNCSTQHIEHIATLEDRIRHLENMLTEQNLTRTQRQIESLSPAFNVITNVGSTTSYQSPSVLPVAVSENSPSALPLSAAGTGLQAVDAFDKSIQPVQWLAPSNSTIVQSSVNAQQHEGLAVHPVVSTDEPHCSDPVAHGDETEDDEESGADADGMGAIASSTYNEPGTGGKSVSEKVYFGPSSTLGFMKHIQDVFRPTKGTRTHKSTMKDDQHKHGYLHAIQRTPISSFARHKYTLPMRELADDLLSSYWTHVHPIYPYLFKSAFNQRYQRLWSASNAPPHRAQNRPVQTGHASDYLEDCYSNEPLFFCILNLVFSLGTHYSQSVDSSERCETGNVFFQRAKEFINLDSLEHSDLVVVQALLLMGHYLQSTDKSSMCWNITGLAIRVSQSIGLDMPIEYNNSAGEPSNQLEAEVRKRLWGGCILHDRVTSMMFGRPLMLPPTSVQHISLLDAIDDEELTTSNTPGRQPVDKPSYIAFFVQAVKLVQIVGEVLDTVYGRGISLAKGTPTSRDPKSRFNPTSRLTDQIKSGDIHEMLQLDMALIQWRENIPLFLQMSTYKTISSDGSTPLSLESDPVLTQLPKELLTIFARQAKVLEARFLHVKILLYRPVLVVLLSTNGSPIATCSSTAPIQTVLRQSMLQQISSHCIQAAQDLTHLIYGSLMSGDVVLPAWWYNVFYLYTTGTIFVAQRLCPSLAPAEDDQKWQECWNMCLRGLSKYSEQSHAPSKCFKVLDLIDKQLFRLNNPIPRTACPPAVPLENPDNIGQPSADLSSSRGIMIPPAEDGFLVGNVSQAPGANAINFNQALDAQDIAWLENIPFDPNIDIDTSVADWLDDFTFSQHDYMAR